MPSIKQTTKLKIDTVLIYYSFIDTASVIFTAL